MPLERFTPLTIPWVWRYRHFFNSWRENFHLCNWFIHECPLSSPLVQKVIPLILLYVTVYRLWKTRVTIKIWASLANPRTYLCEGHLFMKRIYQSCKRMGYLLHPLYYTHMKQRVVVVHKRPFPLLGCFIHGEFWHPMSTLSHYSMNGRSVSD